jgi:DNA-directed RNA polymerase I subunit RPA1
VYYDYTVRDSDGSVIQFNYGDDGLDVMKISCLTEFEVLATVSV